MDNGNEAKKGGPFGGEDPFGTKLGGFTDMGIDEDPLGFAELPPLEPLEVEDPTKGENAVGTYANDNAFIRRKLYHMVCRAEHILNEAIDTARRDKMPRSFEVVATLIKSTADAIKELKDVSKDEMAAEQKREQAALALQRSGSGGSKEAPEDTKKKLNATLTDILGTANEVEGKK